MKRPSYPSSYRLFSKVAPSVVLRWLGIGPSPLARSVFLLEGTLHSFPTPFLLATRI